MNPEPLISEENSQGVKWTCCERKGIALDTWAKTQREKRRAPGDKSLLYNSICLYFCDLESFKDRCYCAIYDVHAEPVMASLLYFKKTPGLKSWIESPLKKEEIAANSITIPEIHKKERSLSVLKSIGNLKSETGQYFTTHLYASR